LESLYNTVEGMVSVRVAERLPDAILKEADEIVNVDLRRGLIEATAKRQNLSAGADRACRR